MGKTSLKYRFYFKGISLLLSFLLLAQNIAWANPDGMNLSAQSIFTHNIRNFGLAKYYTSCVDKVFPDLGTIPGNIHVSAGKDRIPVTMLFPKANELKQTFSLDNNEHIIPFDIDGSIYYVYVTWDDKDRIEEMSVFTETEFTKIVPGAITHRKLPKNFEKDIEHQEVYDIPLSIAHTDKTGMDPLHLGVRKKVLEFFRSFGASDEFLFEAEHFMQTEGTVTLTRKQSDLLLEINGKKYKYPGIVEIKQAHASNNYVNIPQDTYSDIARVLIHELSAKCGMPHHFNEELDAIYDKWNAGFAENGKKPGFLNLTKDGLLSLVRWSFSNKILTLAFGMLLYLHLKQFTYLIPPHDLVFMASLLSFPGVLLLIALITDAFSEQVSARLKKISDRLSIIIKNSSTYRFVVHHPSLNNVMHGSTYLATKLLIPFLRTTLKKTHEKMEDYLAGKKLRYILKFVKIIDSTIWQSSEQKDDKKKEGVSVPIDDVAPKENVYQLATHLIKDLDMLVSNRNALKLSKLASKKVIYSGIMNIFHCSVHILSLYLLKSILTGHGVYTHVLIDISLYTITAIILIRNLFVATNYFLISKGSIKINSPPDYIPSHPHAVQSEKVSETSSAPQQTTYVNHDTVITKIPKLRFTDITKTSYRDLSQNAGPIRKDPFSPQKDKKQTLINAEHHDISRSNTERYMARFEENEYLSAKEREKRSDIIMNILGNADISTQGMVCALIDLALSLENNENGLFALDENLSKEGTLIFVKKLIDDICDITNDEKLKKALRHVIIVSGQSVRLANMVARIHRKWQKWNQDQTHKRYYHHNCSPGIL